MNVKKTLTTSRKRKNGKSAIKKCHALGSFAVSGYYNFTFEIASCHNCMRIVFVFNFYANILKVADALRT